MRVIECIVEVIMLPLMIYGIFVLWNWNKAAKKIQALADKYMEEME